MSSLAQTQAYLRQKRATGRLSPEEMESAYQGFYQNESNQSLARANQDLASRRVDISESQTQQRIDQDNKRIALENERFSLAEKETKANRLAADRVAKEKRDAAKMAGRLQFAKLAVPDLFEREPSGAGSSSENQGGAQSATSEAASGRGTTSSSSKGVPSYGDAYDAAKEDFAPDTSLTAVTGKSIGQHIGSWAGLDGKKSMGSNVAAVSQTGLEGFGLLAGIRAVTDVLSTSYTYAQGYFSGAFSMSEQEEAAAEIGAEMDSLTGLYAQEQEDDIDYASDTDYASDFGGGDAGADGGYGAGYGGTGMGGR